jgi:hypothetical protein
VKYGATTLIVGSYPPIPVPGARVSLAEVRRAWGRGSEVVVVAPRLCAAHLTVPIAGMIAGRRLANVARVTGARNLVLVVEEGYPFSLPGPVLQRATAEVLARAFAAFDHVRIVRAGKVDLHPAAWARLTAAAHEAVEVPAEPAAEGVTPLGPPEDPPVQRGKRVARRSLQRALGPTGLAAYQQARTRVADRRRPQSSSGS